MIQKLIYAARLRTLPLALSCIIVGTAIANYLGAFNWMIFILAIITTISLQILSNFANDLGDGQKGTDNEHRIGPKRAIQSGLISIRQMNTIVKITAVVSFISGIALLSFSNMFWWQILLFILLGIASIAAAIKYTVGEDNYGYKGYGDLFVFLFFGIIGVIGSLFLYIHCINISAILPAIAIGCLSTGVLHLNNMRDFNSDKLSNKNTLAIILGPENAKLYFIFLILTSIISLVIFTFTLNLMSFSNFIFWIGFIPLILIAIRFLKISNNAQYDQLLKPLALSTFFISVLIFISLALCPGYLGIIE